MRVENLQKAKIEVEDNFGRKIITASDCIQLSDEIQKKTGFQLNVNTLRRCFGLVKASYPPSVNTLNVLANYCGYASIDELVKHQNKKQGQHTNDSESSLLTYLISIFKETHLSNYNDATYMSLVKHTINFLKFEPFIIEPFQKAIAKTENGQFFYFEHSVNIDKLNSFYGDGLKFYLLEKKSKEAQLFGHSLLFFRYWLTMDESKIQLHYNEVMKIGLDQINDPSLYARYFTTKLYEATHKKEPLGGIIAEARTYQYASEQNTIKQTATPLFQLIMSEALVLLGEYEEALHYLNNINKKEFTNIPAYIDINILNAIDLFRSIALANKGEIEKAENAFIKIKPEDFYFLSKKYYLILYLVLGRSLRKIKSCSEQLQHLIDETGFKKLGELNLFPFANQKKARTIESKL